MIEISKKQREFLKIFLQFGEMSSSAIQIKLTANGSRTSLVTVKRTLSEMAAAYLLQVIGSGRSTKYKITTLGRVFADIDVRQYCAMEPDRRYGLQHFNFQLLPELPVEIFTPQEVEQLQRATSAYEVRTTDLSVAMQKKELERLVIELSWKSSKIEGNTYTLLDTEKLILENTPAPGHDRKEAKMILNHKAAFTWIYTHAADYRTLTRANLEKLHATLIADLEIDHGFREKPVGVVGSRYQPLDNLHQLTEAVDQLTAAVNRMASPYAKAFVALMGISYIQPFGDGNKRTARLMANALLLSHGRAPLSYRSVDEVAYREATLALYELNTIVLLRRIFVEQYIFAATHYGVKVGEVVEDCLQWRVKRGEKPKR
jgi:fido (protein-threonine AMPylation protein)